MIPDTIKQLQFSHMPFVFYDKDTAVMSFAAKVDGVWKLFYQRGLDTEPIRLSTGLPASVPECAPVMYKNEQQQLCVSYIGGISEDHKYITCYCLNLTAGLKAKIGPAKTGFYIGPKQMCRAHALNVFEYPTADAPDVYVIPDSIELLCIRPDIDNKQRLHISYLDNKRVVRSVLYNTETQETLELRTPDDKPLYKACTVHDGFLYGDMTGSGFEDRRITFIEKNSVIETPVVNVVQRTLKRAHPMFGSPIPSAEIIALLPKELQ